MTTLTRFVSVFASVALLSGCVSSTGYKKSASTSTSLDVTAQGIDNALPSFDAVLTNLTALLNPPDADFTQQFRHFSSEVGKLDSMTRELRGQAAAMQEEGAAYFRNWDNKILTIENDDIRTLSLDRKILVAARFEEVRTGYAQAMTDFDPFMSDLKDIRTALAADLTAGGLESVNGVMRKANRTGQPLRDALVGLSRECKSLGTALSSSTPVT